MKYNADVKKEKNMAIMDFQGKVLSFFEILDSRV